MELEDKKKTFENLDSSTSFQKSRLKIIHRTCYEQFDVETIFLMYHRTEGRVQQLMDERLVS